ncbi:MAG: GNAT family N-acetyltransferase [Clostridia bacterium]|nr:GNAT family N-acetyltransferase [Clostridia bacterium]
MKNDLIAYCGVDCSSCPDLETNKCPGCRQTEWTESDTCMPVECCRKRNISCCGECDVFPCPDMREFYRESEGHKRAYMLMCDVNDKICLRDYTEFCLDEILNLYQSVGWTNYVERKSMLEKAYKNSLCVIGAYAGDRLIGIIRAVGDGFSIVFIQDIIVLPEYRRRGIGTRLIKAIMERYNDVYQMELLTDNTEKTKAFYCSVGLIPSDAVGYIAFIRM